MLCNRANVKSIIPLVENCFWRDKKFPKAAAAYCTQNRFRCHDASNITHSSKLSGNPRSYSSRKLLKETQNRESPKVAPKTNLDTTEPSYDGPEPAYERISFSEEQFYSHYHPFQCEYGDVLPKLEIAYETWGQLNQRRDNAILLFTGVSGSSHAKSHQEVENSRPGWWEAFIGPNGKIDTNKYHVICANFLGGCFGTTGPSSINPNTGKPYGGDFPIISVKDMVEAQFLLLDHLRIHKLHAVVGSSLGGMASLMAAALYPERVARMVSISASAATHPSAIAFRYIQRLALMADPNWRNGHYYETGLPINGMQLARKIATLTYRSGPEWSERFGRKRIKDCDWPRMDGAEFEIEDYIRHQGESFFQKSQYDPNSLLFLSKAVDLFDMKEGFRTMEESLARVTMPCLVMGASSDILVPSDLQVELAEYLVDSGNKNVTLEIIEGKYGHDTFLLDLDGMGGHTMNFLDAIL